MFKFISRLYDIGGDINRVVERDEAGRPIHLDYVDINMSIDIDEIVGFEESISRGSSFSEAIAKGECDCTSITTYTMGTILCVWPYSKFEKKYNEYKEKNKDK